VQDGGPIAIEITGRRVVWISPLKSGRAAGGVRPTSPAHPNGATHCVTRGRQRTVMFVLAFGRRLCSWPLADSSLRQCPARSVCTLKRPCNLSR
jgi:hypothetical protein